MQHGAFPQYPGKPLPADASDADDKIARAGGTPVDIRGAAEWKQILRVDSALYEWGQLVIGAEASAQPYTPAAGDTPAIDWLVTDLYPWAEVRVLVTIGAIDHVWFQGGAGNHSEAAIGGNDKSPGPILLPFLVGEVPDVIEVQARAWRGGLLETDTSDGEILTVTAVSRFRR